MRSPEYDVFNLFFWYTTYLIQQHSEYYFMYYINHFWSHRRLHMYFIFLYSLIYTLLSIKWISLGILIRNVGHFNQTIIH